MIMPPPSKSNTLVTVNSRKKHTLHMIYYTTKQPTTACCFRKFFVPCPNTRGCRCRNHCFCTAVVIHVSYIRVSYIMCKLGASHGAMGGSGRHARHLGARGWPGVLHLAPDHHGGDPQGPRPRRDLHHLHPHGLRPFLQDLDRGVGIVREGIYIILRMIKSVG